MPDVQPLDVMLELMAKHRGSGEDKLALEAAKAAAPYVHAKPGAAARNFDLGRISDDELEKYCRGEQYLFGEEGEGSEEADPDGSE